MQLYPQSVINYLHFFFKIKLIPIKSFFGKFSKWHDNVFAILHCFTSILLIIYSLIRSLFKGAIRTIKKMLYTHSYKRQFI